MELPSLLTPKRELGATIEQTIELRSRTTSLVRNSFRVSVQLVAFWIWTFEFDLFECTLNKWVDLYSRVEGFLAINVGAVGILYIFNAWLAYQLAAGTAAGCRMNHIFANRANEVLLDPFSRQADWKSVI